MKRPAPYKVYALDERGRRSLIKAHGLIVELKKGIEVELDFAPHPNFAGELHLLTPAAANMKAEYRAGRVDDFAVSFGASNILHVSVERRRRTRSRRKG
jgi:hypothetical protein